MQLQVIIGNVCDTHGHVGLNIADFYHFNPVPIGGPIRILGALFEFDYSFQ